MFKKYLILSVFAVLAFVSISLFSENVFAQQYICKDGQIVSDFNSCLATTSTSYVSNQISDEFKYLTVGSFNNLDPTDYEYCLYLPITLQYKSRGQDVIALQDYLTDRGFLETGSTGYFGRATELAIKKFQFKNELQPTGIAGPETRETLKSLTCEERTITKTVTIFKKTYPLGRVYQDVDFTDQAFISSQSQASQVLKTNKVSTVSSTKSSTSTASTSNTANVYINKQPTSSMVLTQQIITAPTLNLSNTSTNLSSKLSITSGVFSSINKNNLYLIYKSTVSTPRICLDLNKTDCSNAANYQPLTDGMNNTLFEASNLSSQWLITLHYGDSWGGVGSVVKLYFKDTQSETPSIYTVSIN